MWGTIIAAVSGAVIGGAVQGITAYETTEQKVGAYKKAAGDVRNATNKYSGKNALDTMVTAGKDYTTEMGNAVGGQMVADNIAPTGPGVTGAGANTNAYNRTKNVGNLVQSAAQNGFNQGVANAQAMNNALYNKETVGAQQAMNQADINYNVANQAVQEGMNTVGNIAQTYNTIKSDERLKDDEQASVEDALRQIESINYKYKPETGLDQDEHVGVTAQSVEGTALDNGMVSEDENGYKQLDKQKLMESIFAAQAALQKQIDELKNSEKGKFTSDEICKDIENVIESNPVEAAKEIENPELKEEAVQAIDGGADAEVNNEVVEEAVKNEPEELKEDVEQLTNYEATKKAGSFMIDVPTKEVSQQEYNNMSIEDLEKADAEAMKGDADYLVVANDLGLDKNDLYYFEDPTFVNELIEEQKEEIKNEPDKEKKIGLLNKIKEAIGSFSTGKSELDINTEDVANSENASTPLTSGVSPTSPSFASGSNGAGVNFSNQVGNVENEVEPKDSKAHSTSANEIEVAEKEQNDGSMNSANQNEHLDDTLDNLSFEETEHNEEVKSNEQFELGGTEGHTSNSNEGVQLPKLNSADDVKKAIIDDSKNWNGENSGSRFLPFKFTIFGDDVIVSQIGTARKEEFDLFAKDEPGSVKQIKAILSNK